MKYFYEYNMKNYTGTLYLCDLNYANYYKCDMVDGEPTNIMAGEYRLNGTTHNDELYWRESYIKPADVKPFFADESFAELTSNIISTCTNRLSLLISIRDVVAGNRVFNQ